MTTLTIIPSHGSKMARFAGSVAAGELVQVTIVGAADWISPDGESQTLRLRVVAMSSGATLAEFRRGETAAWTATGGNAVCTLNLNTVEMLSAVPKHARRPFLFVLDDAESHTLYFKSAYPVSHWPQRTGEDAPADLGGYRDFVEECKEAMRGAEGSALESAQHAAQSEEAAQSAKSAAESSALNASGSANLAGEYAARAEAAKSAIDGRNYINGAVYDSNTKKILLKNGDRVVAEIDATAFVKDGMVSSVVISGGNLVITFNTDAGQQPISIPITDIFDPSLYYTKTEADTKFAAKQDKLYRIVWAFAGTTADAQAFVAASANLALENVAPKTFELSGYDTTSYYVTPVVTTNPDPTDLTFVLMDAAMTSMLGMVTATRSEVAVSSHVVDEIGDTSNIPTAAAVKKSIDDLSGKIPEKATSVPLMAGTAAVGSSNKYASENHVHPAETEVVELYAPVSLPASAFPVTYTYTNGGTSEVVELNVSNVTYYDGGSTWLLQDNTHGDITLCEFSKDGTFQYAWQQVEDIKFNGVAPVANASPCLVSDNMKVRVRGGKFVTFGDFDTSPTKDSRKAVTSGGIWSALWGALASLPTGFTSLYDWEVSQLRLKRDHTDLSYNTTETIEVPVIRATVSGNGQSIVADLECNETVPDPPAINHVYTWQNEAVGLKITQGHGALVTTWTLYVGGVQEDAYTTQNATQGRYPDLSFSVGSAGGTVTTTKTTAQKIVTHRDSLALTSQIPAVIAPSTSASDSGKAADAKATGDALAGKLDTSAVVAPSTSSSAQGKAADALQTGIGISNATNSANYAKTIADQKYLKPSSGIPKSDLASDVQSSLGKADAAAPLYSPAFTGTPTAPTPTPQSGDTQVANKKYVDDAVAGVTPDLDYVMRVDPETGGIYYTTPDTNA